MTSLFMFVLSGKIGRYNHRSYRVSNNINATQIEKENFELRINYRDDAVGFNNPSLNEGTLTRDKPLIRLLGLDRLNFSNDPQYDGNFDFVEGFTINSKKGNIIFPVLEPFG